LEDYRVTLAELLMPAADISEQISLAGTEASGTSNMKLMINGAVTLGTLDGANVEIHDAVGDENMILFGMTAPQVSELKNSGYRPKSFADGSPAISGALREMDAGFCGVSFHDIADSLLNRDPYMVLADFASYEKARAKSAEWYADPAAWQRMCLVNVAQAGRFAADRAVREYAEKIWRAQPVPPEENEGKKANRRHKFGKA
jgi:starch phosphorylase